MKKGLFRFATPVAIALLFSTLLSAQNTSPYWSLAGNSNATTSSKLGTTNNVYLRFFANNTERGRINTNGNWGIGDVGTDARVTIASAAGARAFRVRVGGDTKLAVQGNGGVTIGTLNPGPANGLYVVGDVGIGTAAPANKVHVRQSIPNRAIQWQHESTTDFWTVGIGTNTLNCRFEFNGLYKAQINSTDGSYIQASDVRLKQDIAGLPTILDKVMQLKPSSYFYKASHSAAKQKSIGFIAQEVEPLFPEVVHEEDGGYKMLNYAAFSVLAIKAVQEQQQQIAALKEQVAGVDELKQELAELRKLVLQLRGANISAVNGSLEQNTPNPVRGVTTIRYTIPQTAASARLTLTNAKGELVQTIAINSKGAGQLALNTAALASGTYQYSLWVDGKQTDTKRLVVMQ